MAGMTSSVARGLQRPAETKIVIYVFDGLGGLPNSRGRTELEEADTKYLDRMAEQGSLGQLMPVAHGITPGPATAFMALLGYDPLTTSLDEGAEIEPFADRLKVRTAVVSASERHIALAKRAGLPVVSSGNKPADLVEAVGERWSDFDCFIVHHRPTLTGDGKARFTAKKAAIAAFDRAVPAIMRLDPDLLVVTGDRTSPAIEEGDTWHPVPLLFTGHRTLPDESHYFSELGCARGVLGTIRACDVLTVALAHAGRLEPFGP
jgi:2,3-bisphosphoglycerate-independent phosphoglycerate mutase